MLACLAVSIGLVWVAFRKDLSEPLTRSAPLPPIRLQRNGLAVTLGVGFGVVIGWPLWITASAPTPGSIQ